MHIITKKLLTLIFLFQLVANAQQEFFLDTQNSFYFFCIEKDNNGGYIASYNEDSLDTHYWGGLVKFDSDFNHQIFTREIDTMDILFHGLVVTEDNNYLLAGTIGRDTTAWEYNHTIYFLLVDENFNVLSEDFLELPPEYTHPFVKMFTNDDGRIYATLNIGAPDNLLKGFIEISHTGQIIKEHMYFGMGTTIMSPFPKPGGNGFYLLRNSTSYQSIGEITEVDTNFNLTSHLLPPYINGQYYDMGPTRGSCKWLNDTSYVLVSEGSLESPSRDLYIYKMNAQHEFLTEPFILGQDNITDNSIRVRGVDWTDPGHIYVASWYWPSINYTLPYYVAVFDEGFNVLGAKSIGGGKDNLLVNSILATDDGGCLMVGGQRDIEAGDEYDWNGYVAFFGPDDIITSATETKNPYDSDYLLFPNPGTNRLTVQTARKGTVLRMYGPGGQLALEQKLGNGFRSQIGTESLGPGLYHCLLTDKQGNVEHKKWIKY